ncbi:hypothetical protein [Hymenobacter sp. BT491]|uniref:hypothetical protein n=1 Tax=Hymenobacter sp. BT491 TaxID=2766779 RepID=UPI0016536DB6|nr:hypothetical protein [Hymenobacter sp. BT491]MBC6988917.1 hypothetical protein [Hymenobacter sp. BT491]
MSYAQTPAAKPLPTLCLTGAQRVALADSLRKIPHLREAYKSQLLATQTADAQLVERDRQYQSQAVSLQEASSKANKRGILNFLLTAALGVLLYISITH